MKEVIGGGIAFAGVLAIWLGPICAFFTGVVMAVKGDFLAGLATWLILGFASWAAGMILMFIGAALGDY